VAIIKHPTELTPGTLHYLVFLGDVDNDENFPKEAPRGWCRFERWERMCLTKFGGEWAFYAHFKMADGSQVVLGVDMVTGKNTIKNLWNDIYPDHAQEHL